MSNLQTYKFIFTAQIGVLNIKANVSSPTFVTWKRSQETAISQTIDMTNGKGDFAKEELKLPVNMYYDKTAECFQQKKSAFSFTMKTPKGQKTAGVAYVDLSKMLNNKIEETNEQYTLQKCPVNGSTVAIRITCECLGQNSGDTQSQASISIMGGSPSTLSLQSIDKSQKVESKPSSAVKQNKKTQENEEVQVLRKKVDQLTRQNKKLNNELTEAKLALKADGNKEEMLKVKSLQNRLEGEVNNLREQKVTHQKELQSLRQKLQDVYRNLYNNLEHFI